MNNDKKNNFQMLAVHDEISLKSVQPENLTNEMVQLHSAIISEDFKTLLGHIILLALPTPSVHLH